MKIFKIIVGLLLIVSAGREYVSASRQLGSLFSPGIIIGILAMLFLATWLLGSALSTEKLKFKSMQFVKYFVASLASFVIVALLHLRTKAEPANYYEINGLNVPLGKCISGTRNMIDNRLDRIAYCKCLVEKITNDPELKIKYRTKLENDEVSEVMEQLKDDQKLLTLGIESCMSTSQIQWTDNMADAMKTKLRNELLGTEFENTHDVEKYCDCLVAEYRKFPFDKIINEGFSQSEEALEIQEKCSNLSVIEVNTSK